MNIFILNNDARLAAKDVIDKHAIKMPLESLQMMSTIADFLGLNSPYNPVMLNHPCTIWGRKSKQNFAWLLNHANALCQEYSLRYNNRTHRCQTIINRNYEVWNKVMQLLPDIGLTPFAIAISQDSKCRQLENFEELHAVDKYREYYMYDKSRIASWKTKQPLWFTNKGEK